MAFLRFNRDTRGYEHFYLVQQTTNRRGKVRPRLLYWFRTPPNVKVGRQPFDDAVRRALEAQNPDIQFDWQAILDTPIPPPVEAEPWRERRRFERAARQAAAEETREVPSDPVAASDPPSPLHGFGGFGEPGPQETIEDHEVSPLPLSSFREPGPPPSPLRGFGEPGPETPEASGEPRVEAAPAGSIDAGRRKRRRRRGRRGRPIVPGTSDQSVAPDSGAQPPIEDTEPSDPEGE
jgi:hypothetical protein